MFSVFCFNCSPGERGEKRLREPVTDGDNPLSLKKGFELMVIGWRVYCGEGGDYISGRKRGSEVCCFAYPSIYLASLRGETQPRANAPFVFSLFSSSLQAARRSLHAFAHPSLSRTAGPWGGQGAAALHPSSLGLFQPLSAVTPSPAPALPAAVRSLQSIERGLVRAWS